MIIAKYKAVYLSYFSSYIRSGDRLIHMLIVLTSSGGVGGWLIWKEIPYVWAVMIGAAQLLSVVKPFLPFLKDQVNYAKTVQFYEELHLSYDKLWTELKRFENLGKAGKEFYTLRDKEVSYFKPSHQFYTPRWKSVDRKTETDWNEYLKQNYST